MRHHSIPPINRYAEKVTGGHRILLWFAEAVSQSSMKITNSINWVITCIANFEKTMAFFRDVMGLALTAQGVPVTDIQFARYAQFTLVNGNVLEIVKPTAEVQQLYTAPIASFTVDDVRQARRELEDRQMTFVAPIFCTKDGWGGHTFERQMEISTSFRAHTSNDQKSGTVPLFSAPSTYMGMWRAQLQPCSRHGLCTTTNKAGQSAVVREGAAQPAFAVDRLRGS